MIMAKLQKFGRMRQLHTIISRELVKPSSPTPSHLKTHHLSLLDQFAAHIHMPIVFFFPNYNNEQTNILKKSLSESLTQYYPFAGRFLGPHVNHINCNDEGVQFLEASIDSRFQDFILEKEKEEIVDQLIPSGLGCSVDVTSSNLVEVQVNHFTDGGAAVAVSISHKVGDGFTMVNFFNHWASVARGGSPINPSFILSSISDTKMPGFVLKGIEKLNYTRKRFVFPNSKLNELKMKVNAMTTTPMNPTRVELVTSLLFKCAAGAATTKSGSSKPSNLFLSVNMRNKIIKNVPEIAAGNISTMVIVNMADSGEIKLNDVIAKLRKGMKELEGLRDVQEAAGDQLSRFSMLAGDHETRAYTFSSLCSSTLPLYELDFGWGKPVEIMVRFPDVNDNCVLLMDTPSRDGIEALVRLQKEEMAILQKDEALLAYVEDI
ncbi:hypothetical protein L2E82_42958 [Cichorium intybus]|uniref:Uncharacterized protein n=1 Tax=Cichorium intybus TaxID=13427 RepID=A0ACB8ZNV8_CICIN|nr:hypothetical protein L2E82_42958 [Cichorium intybus]